MRLRLPKAFLSYACRRTLACCRAPTRAPIDDEDLRRILPTLRASDGPGPVLARRLEGAIEPLGELAVVAQPGGACAMLAADPAPPRCRLQAAAGMGALPEGCRNFPRSVVALGGPGAAWEIAFTPRCPTVAGLLARTTSPFELVSVERPAWPYAATRGAPASLRVDHEGDAEVSLSAWTEARAAWWSLVAEASSDVAALQGIMGALAEDPTRPRARPDGAPHRAASEPDGVAVAELVRGLLSLPERGADYVDLQWEVWAASSGPRRVAGDPRRIAVALSNELQWIGVHGARPLRQGASLACRRVAMAAAVARVLEARAGAPPEVAWADALTASAHVGLTG